MFRTTVTAAAAALALTVLTACGGPVKVGSAVTIGDDRIATTSLDSAVAEWQKAYQADPRPAQDLQLADPESTQRSVLARLISFRVFEQAAADNGVTVSPAEIDQAITEVTRGGGTKAFNELAMVYGIPPEYSRDFAKMLVTGDKLLAKLGGPITDQASQQAAQQKVGALVAQTADRMDIKVNPRFGTFDQGALGPVLTQLSRTETGTT